MPETFIQGLRDAVNLRRLWDVALQITGGTITGNLTVQGDLIVDDTIRAPDEESLVGISGGSTLSTGANILAYGQSHATLAGDMFFRSGTSSFMWRDHSASTTYHYGDATFDGGVLHVDSTNDRVGVNTTTPSRALHVQEDTLNEAALHIGRYNAASAQLLGIGEHSAVGGVAASYGGALFHAANRGIGFSTYNGSFESVSSTNVDLFIKAGGNVGIGTSSPNEVLDVNGNIAVGPKSDGTKRFKIKPNTAPAVSVGGSTLATVLEAQGTSTSSYHVGVEIPSNDTSDGFYIATDSNQDGTVDTLAMKINAAGNVGIKTTSPSVALHVVGEIKTTPVTVANLPSAATVGAGARAFVSDATATTFASVVAGTGANNVPVYSDGTNWRIG